MRVIRMIRKIGIIRKIRIVMKIEIIRKIRIIGNNYDRKFRICRILDMYVCR